MTEPHESHLTWSRLQQLKEENGSELKPIGADPFEYNKASREAKAEADDYVLTVKNSPCCATFQCLKQESLTPAMISNIGHFYHSTLTNEAERDQFLLTTVAAGEELVPKQQEDGTGAERLVRTYHLAQHRVCEHAFRLILRLSSNKLTKVRKMLSEGVHKAAVRTEAELSREESVSFSYMDHALTEIFTCHCDPISDSYWSLPPYLDNMTIFRMVQAQYADDSSREHDVSSLIPTVAPTFTMFLEVMRANWSKVHKSRWTDQKRCSDCVTYAGAMSNPELSVAAKREVRERRRRHVKEFTSERHFSVELESAARADPEHSSYVRADKRGPVHAANPFQYDKVCNTFLLSFIHAQVVCSVRRFPFVLQL